MTSHPRLVDDDLVAALAEVGPIAPYLHLPAQSGSDRVLSPHEAPLHVRPSTSRPSGGSARGVPGIALSSDFIVGFPGETDEDFEDDARPRRATSASPASSASATRRGPGTARRGGGARRGPRGGRGRALQRLLDLQAGIQREINGRLVGREFEILVEGENRHGPDDRAARPATGSSTSSRAEADALAPGRTPRVRITRGLPNSLAGRLAT